MKRIIYSLTAVLALVACSKEQESLDYELFDGEVSTIIAKFNPVTKTTVELAGDQAAYTWEESETISVFDGSTALTYTVVDRNAGTFQYAGSPAGELAYAVSPADALSSPSAGSYELTIKSNYTGYKSNVSNAIMVAGAPSDVIDGKPVFAFQHAAALMRFTYENVPVGTTGLKFSTDKKINGTFTVSGSTPELTLANASGTTETKLTLASAVSSANTSIIFYVPIPTGNYSTFTVTLFNGEGDIDSTTKTMNAAFTATKGHVINTPVITLDRVGASYYQKITSTGDLSDGDYLIVYETDNLAFDGSLDALDVASNTIEIEISDNKIISNSTIDASAFTYNSTDETLQSKSGYYIGRTADSNGMNSDESTKYTNSISFDDNNVVITASGGAVLRYNATSGQERFRYFKSSTYTSQKAIQLYKKVAEASLPQLSIPQAIVVDAATKRVSWHSVTNADSYTVTINGVAHDNITNTYYVSDIADGYYDVSVQAISSDHAVRYDSAVATVEDQKFGNPKLSTPSGFTPESVSESSITVAWTAVDGATKYHCTISPANAAAQDVTTNSVTFSGLTENESYTISVYAIDETGRYSNSLTGSSSSIKAVSLGVSYSYTFTSNPFDDYDGRDSNTETTESAKLGSYTWNLTATYIKVNTSPYLQLTTGSRTDTATFSNTDYNQNITKIVLVVKTNSSKSVTVSASVDGTNFTCDKSTTVSSTSDVTLTFTSATLKKGEIKFEFTGATGGYYLKSFSINPD